MVAVEVSGGWDDVSHDDDDDDVEADNADRNADDDNDNDCHGGYAKW